MNGTDLVKQGAEATGGAKVGKITEEIMDLLASLDDSLNMMPDDWQPGEGEHFLFPSRWLADMRAKYRQLRSEG